jgi:predicted kinase
MTLEHKGLHTCRFSDNPLEKRFADAWRNVNSGNHCLLDYLLAKDNNRPCGEVTERDAVVAATIIQWLGSPVGQAFIMDVTGKQ